jgi:hypothetical protein
MIKSIDVTIAPGNLVGLAQAHEEIRWDYVERVVYGLEALYPDASVSVRIGGAETALDVVRVEGPVDVLPMVEADVRRVAA